MPESQVSGVASFVFFFSFFSSSADRMHHRSSSLSCPSSSFGSVCTSLLVCISHTRRVYVHISKTGENRLICMDLPVSIFFNDEQRKIVHVLISLLLVCLFLSPISGEIERWSEKARRQNNNRQGKSLLKDIFLLLIQPSFSVVAMMISK